jgi:hypothetical protein
VFFGKKVDLSLNEEVSEAIKTMQGGILTILDLLDVGDGVLEPAGGAPSASASSSTSSSTCNSPAATLTARTRNAAELKSELTAVFWLANRGKTEEARATLAKIPSGKELLIRLIDKAAKAMEVLLLERGDLGSVRRILLQFFDRPIIRTAMSDHFRERPSPRHRGHHGDGGFDQGLLHGHPEDTRPPHGPGPERLLRGAGNRSEGRA